MLRTSLDAGRRRRMTADAERMTDDTLRMTHVAASLLAILMKERGGRPGSSGGAWSSYVATDAVSPVFTPGAAGLLQLL